MPTDPATNGRDDALAHAALDAELADLDELTPEDFTLPASSREPDLLPWFTLNPVALLPLILESPAEQWYVDHARRVLAHFRYDAAQWGKILSRWGSLYQKAYLLEAAVDAWIRAHPDEALDAKAQRDAVYKSSDPEVWHGALGLLIDIRDNASDWFLATSKAHQRGINVNALTKAVDEGKTARKKAQAHDAENTSSPSTTPTKNPEPSITLLAEEWGIPIVGCIRHGTDNATWHLKLEDGKEIGIGPSKNLLSETAVRIAIFDATGKSIKHYGKAQQEQWRILVEVIAAIAVTVDTPEMTAKGQALALIRAYLGDEFRLDINTEEWETEAEDNKPFVRKGFVYVHARDIWSTYARSMMPELDHKAILEFLRLLGGYYTRITLNTVKSSRGMWAIPVENIIESQQGRAETETTENRSTSLQEKSTKVLSSNHESTFFEDEIGVDTD